MNKRGNRNFSQLAYSHSGSQGTLGIIYRLRDQGSDFLKTWSKVSKIAHDHPHLHSGSPSLKYLRFVLLWSYIITKSWILKVCSAFFSIILTEQYSLLCTWHTGLSPSGSPGRCWCRAQATIFPYCWNQLSEIINCHGCWMDVGLCSSRQFGTPGHLAYAETL